MNLSVSSPDLKSTTPAEPAMEAVVERLLNSSEPSIRLRTRTEILGETDSRRVTAEQSNVKQSERVRKLLSERVNSILSCHPYSKWYGAHWVLSALADLGYPKKDDSLIPLREQVYEWLFSKAHLEYVRGHEAYAGPVIRARGLARAHASMEGNAVYYLHSLGLADDRTATLADRLLEWQWPDGGWNCDKRTGAHTSSFTESLLPLRGLAFHELSSGGEYRDPVRRAAEFFLDRDLFKRKRDGKVISSKFTKLHYPCYWHYDILFGLKVMKEAGFIRDARCADALSLLESKRLSDGGFPAEEAYYQATARTGSRRSLVSWGGVNQRRLNEYVTCDALSVLKAARPVC
jgi:hypothetical protein